MGAAARTSLVVLGPLKGWFVGEGVEHHRQNGSALRIAS